ncbi:asparagine synthase-related protein [Streptomyces collinus]|uniref:asparagine synthase-related protein n=1 Tax=Streptomyces collinus TaxID=42684 RepID=UPI00362B3960
MEALRLDWAGGAPRLRAAADLTRQGLVTALTAPAGAAVVVGWAGSHRDREAGARRLLEDFGRRHAAPRLPIGDYAAVLLYPDRVVLLRDEQARIPLFFRESGGRVSAVGTSARGLGGGTELERRYFCRYLTGNPAQPHTDLTPFTDVHRVLGGEVVELAITGHLLGRTRSHIRPARARPSPAADGPDTAGAAKELRRALEDAVDRRMGTTTACHVSGGTDSTSVALLAARRPAPGRLVLLAGRFAGGELAGEAPYLDEALTEIRRHAPDARALIVDADDVADFDDFPHHAGDSDEPQPHAFRAPFWARLHTAAAELGCDALLTGCGADPIADANPFHLHRLARTGRFPLLAREARAWAAGSERGVRDIVHAYVVRPALPLTAERLTALGRGGTVLGGLGDFGRPRWLRPVFARTHGYGRARVAESRFVFGRRPEESLYDAANYAAAPDPLSWHRAPQDGFFLSHPFLDPEVVATMRGLSPAATFRPGHPKAVLREAMADLLPPGIQARTAKIPFNQLYARGLRRHTDTLLDLCRHARHPLTEEMFDIAALSHALREAQLGIGDAYAWDRMNRTLALVAWLERLDRNPATFTGSLPVTAGLP